MSDPLNLTLTALQAYPLPDASSATDKNSRGRILAIAGSAGAPGAAILVGTAALAAGAGKVQLATPRSIAPAIGASFLEAGLLGLDETEDGEPIAAPEEAFRKAVTAADAVLVGPGLLNQAAAKDVLYATLKARDEATIIIDALSLCSAGHLKPLIRSCAGKVILTPHHGEMAQLLGLEMAEISRDPLKYALATAKEFDVVVILKAATTFVATPEGRAWEHNGGIIGLATAGSGDVLAGIVSGLVARGADLVTASLWAVFAHAQAGQALSKEVAKVGFLASELLPLIPGLIEGFSSRASGSAKNH